MPTFRHTLLVLACGLMPVAGTLAEEAGVVRITDRHDGPTPTTTIAPVSHEWVEGDGFIGGPEVIGDYGSHAGNEWCLGAGGADCYGDACCECYVCPSCPGITGNPILDAPTRGLCELILCIFCKKQCCPSGHCGAYGAHAAGARGRSGTRIYAVDPNHFDPRDGRVYSAPGYGMPMAVPLAPTVHHTYNYGWGVPSSRVTPVSRPYPY